MVPPRSDELQRTVLDAAIAIAANEGPDAISMRDIARRAGVSHQAPYHHFGDRTGIFAAIVEEGFIELAARLELSRSTGASSMCEAYVHFALGHRGHFRVMFRADLCNLANYPSAASVAEQAFAVLINEVKSIVGDSTDENLIRTQATFMWSIAHGLATLLIDGPLESRFGEFGDVDELIRDVSLIAARSLQA